MFLWAPAPLLNGEGGGFSGLTVSPDYFRTLGIPIVEGRAFTAADTVTSEPVAIINEAARGAPGFHGRDPLGQEVQTVDNKMETVVGVVGNVHSFRLDVKPWFTIYVPITQSPGPGNALLVRTAGDPLVVTNVLRQAVQEGAAGAEVSRPQTLNEMISTSLAAPRFQTALLGLFAGLALVLAVLGIYGLMSDAVRRRAHEMGIRLAMGAQPREVLGMVLRQALWLALAGIAIGVAGAAALARLLAWFLFGVSPLDPLTFAAVPALLAAAAVAACLGPALRAARVDPVVALRWE